MKNKQKFFLSEIFFLEEKNYFSYLINTLSPGLFTPVLLHNNNIEILKVAK
jgi:hypothetical protein